MAGAEGIVAVGCDSGVRGGPQGSNATYKHHGNHQWVGLGVDGSSAHSLFFMTERRPFMPRGHEDAQKPLSIGRDGLWHLRSSAGGWYLQFCRIDDTNTHVLACLLVCDKKDTSFGHLFFHRGPKFWTERLYLSPPGGQQVQFLSDKRSRTNKPTSIESHALHKLRCIDQKRPWTRRIPG